MKKQNQLNKLNGTRANVAREIPGSKLQIPPETLTPGPSPIRNERGELEPGHLLPEGMDVEPWAEAVEGKGLLDALVLVLRRFVVLPKWAAETLALWIVHTYAFQLREVSTYVGIESPEKRCGKTTLLSVLGELLHRPVVASNISSPAFFRVIEELQPTLLIDEADTFLRGNDELRGILNSGYTKKSAFVWRVSNEVRGSERKSVGALEREGKNPKGNGTSPRPSPQSGEGGPSGRAPLEKAKELNGLNKLNGPSGLAPFHNEEGNTSPRPSPQSGEGEALANGRGSRPKAMKFSCWCPKAVAAIGRLPDTLADRCIVIRMQRKTSEEQCERLRDLETTGLRRQCSRFVADNAAAIASARPEIPKSLNDRAGDIWEPLLVLADLAGGDWPEKARQAAAALTAGAQENSPIGSLLFDICLMFTISNPNPDRSEGSESGGPRRDGRIFTRTLLEGLSTHFGNRPWAEMAGFRGATTNGKGKELTDTWLARQLRPYGIRSKTIWIGEEHAKGYVEEDFTEVFRRYIPRSEIEAWKAEWASERGVK